MAKQVNYGSISPSELRVLQAIVRSQETFAPVNPSWREIADEAGINVSWAFRATVRLDNGGFVKMPSCNGVKGKNRSRIVITKRGQQVLEVVKRKSA